MTKRNKSAGENLTKAHRQIGIKAVAAAVEVNKQKATQTKREQTNRKKRQ